MTLARLLLFTVAIASTPLPAGQSILPEPEGNAAPIYVCPPCPHVKDLFRAERHDEPGTCPICGMARVELPVAADASLALLEGSGAFALKVGPGASREVSVFYYRPKRLAERSPVLIVLPGAGRNAWDYRDHWIDAADAHGVLVLSLHYPETDYPEFWSYNLAGMISDVEIDAAARTMARYRINADSRTWLFDDIDAVFGHVVRVTGLKTPGYDLFGHSAGGQFLHRFALFARETSLVNRIVAANAGWYTTTDRVERFPYGLADAPITDRQLAAGFKRRLVVLLGGNDDENETRGELVRNEQTDRQGLHRIARGRHFFSLASADAGKLDMKFHWTLRIVPDVGHDAKAMSRAAASVLYGDADPSP
jgi:hypothetical protein